MALSLKSIVDDLSQWSNFQRRVRIINHLQELKVPYVEQMFWLGYSANILVDLPGADSAHGIDSAQKRLLLSSHYDVVANSPGANDNASAVAVLLGVIEKYHAAPPPFPLRIAFFDQEEQQLRGSRKYVERCGVEDLAAVLNLEMVGRGSIPVYWPAAIQGQEYLRILSEAAQNPYFISYQHGHSGDHQSFVDAGFRDALCLTLVDERDRNLLQEVQELLQKPTQCDLVEVSQKVKASYTFQDYHNSRDEAQHIREESLEMAKNIIFKVVDGFSERDDKVQSDDKRKREGSTTLFLT